MADAGGRSGRPGAWEGRAIPRTLAGRRRPWQRTERLAMALTPAELADLADVARAWNVPAGTAAWAIVHTFLRKARARAPELGDVGVAIAASAAVLGLRLPATRHGPGREARVELAELGPDEPAEGS